MNAQKSAVIQHFASAADIQMDDWLNLVSILRERRKRYLGPDLLNDPPWAIFVTLGRDSNAGGLPFESLVSAAGVSPETTCRWLSILLKRGFVERSSRAQFKLSGEGKVQLQRVFS